MCVRFLAVAAVAAAMGACASVETEGEEGRRLAGLSLPSMPALPSMDVSDVRIPGTGRKAPEVDHTLEPVIYWREMPGDILVVHVDTNGCTSKGHFSADVEQYHEDVYTLRLVRSMTDYCEEELPWGEQIAFGYEELGVPAGGRVILLNPIDNRPWDWNQTVPAARD